MRINFQKYTISEIFIKNKKKWIYDDIRRMDVLLTPEEVVRQKVIRFLLEEIKVPKHMLHVEAPLSYYHLESNRRADILVLKKDEVNGIPIPLACDYIILTNGEETVVAAWDFEKEQYRDIKNVPVYDEMIKNLHQWLEE